MRVLLVDDHHLFRVGLRTLLEAEGMEVVDAPDGAAALAALTAGPRPDVVLTDLEMPGMSGVEVTRAVRALEDAPAVVLLTVVTDDRQVVDAVRAGASGYLLKDAPPQEVVAALRAARGGAVVLASGMAGRVVGRAVEDERTPVAWGLTPREREVLEHLARGLDNAEIAAVLSVSPSTVKGAVSAILDKLEVGNRVQAAVLATRAGLGG